MKRADKRQKKTKDPCKEIPIYSVVQSTHSVPHEVCQISGSSFMIYFKYEYKCYINTRPICKFYTAMSIAMYLQAYNGKFNNPYVLSYSTKKINKQCFWVKKAKKKDTN
jgi:hypothetical protein